MVNVKSWKEYQSKSLEMFNKDPKRYRYCLKFRSNKGDLVLKSTNNDECLKYKTQSTSILNRFEQFNRTLIYNMSNTPIPELPPVVEQQQQPPASQQPSESSSSKKKKNKKKK
ncbi:signal recognition particle, SRP9/SRP14 subunit [Wallemia mellicola CBS 633.66]|uniref:SRP9 domain-containing protein n=2 Tax=Wallemia mellicola TaxID=1708541 RepID=A0A4T0P0Y4_9BASI|nr:signal recognition particle, SRP9/SRP14 subunit [Wallemia mellicola CBS 633.66]TIB69240.1 hypothetical protein E3Q24_03417 [Wallemia mellicola]EIM24021.1 signal recognition particle, SRP9/SRP14 subunit [Wallemia mellicola CBS 633.66]TIB79437.1 hypothetical protein E3Q23_00248 [Wallemia mellicola]TIB97255.1 hypothetical protein E3Q17_03478 [Wallemia mellicola]TIC02377.1 hypothetical protein E3Q16_03532 [Wallemia mellicola]|eukprot:XP_006955854.1 signal recognition particle, SRP9/SRP14 subunit [Wallemia mellicola CBS 633.66]